MEQNQQRNVMELDIKEIFSVIIQKIMLISIIGVICGAVGFLVSTYVIPEKYESSTKVYVLNKENNSSLTYTDMETGRQLTKDYVELITATPVLRSVIDELNLKMDTEQLKNMVSVEVPLDTRILKITVTSENREDAKNIADSIRIAASNHISKVMDIENVNVVEYAALPKEPISPNVGINTIIAAALGVLLSIFVIVLLYSLDDTIKNSDDVEKYLGVSVLGTIPERSNSRKTIKGKWGK